MDNIPEGHVLVKVSEYKEFISPKEKNSEILIKEDVKKIWDIKKSKTIVSPKNRKKNKKKHKKMSVKERKERAKVLIHESRWKNMDYGDKTKAGKVRNGK